MDLTSRRRSFALLLVALALAGCSTNYYRKSADTATYSVILEKTPLVRNMDRRFTISQTNLPDLNRFPVSTNVVDFLGQDSGMERGAKALNLEESLDIAVKSSRRYQSRKESLYLSALSLTLARHSFTPIFSAGIPLKYQEEVDEITGSGGVSDGVVERRSVSAGAHLGADWLIRDVGRISAAFTTSALRLLSGDGAVAASSALRGTFVRPLVRNAGYKAESDALTQAERDVLYDLRDFVQFRKDFSVETATAYYGVLGRKDVARNTYLSLLSSRKNAERSRALAKEGRITQSDLGRLEQQELTSEGSWISAVRNYKQDLDNFKILIGLPVDAAIVLDDADLRRLQILDPSLSEDDSIRIALASRTDYQTAKDRVVDAERVVTLRANFLQPKIDLAANVVATSDPTKANRFSFPDFQRYTWDAGLDIDPGLDRVAERDAYRSAIISRNRAARDAEQTGDDIQLRVRDSWRTLDQAKRSYEISEIGVKLAERRVEEQNLLAELGRAKAQDQVDAENDLINSRNQKIQALVSHTIARLQFWNRLGILYIKDNGQWEETEDAKAQ